MHQCRIKIGLFGTSSLGNWLVFDNQEANQERLLDS